MAKFKSDFLNTLDERGFIHQCSDFAGLDALAARGEVVGYIGFDCTAPSFHIGNMIVLMMLHWLQQTGNKPIVLMGGGTTRVGDPSGKDETRKILAVEQIEANKASMQKAAAKLMKFGSGPTDAITLDNAEWLTRLNYIEMLRDIGRHFSVNRMLTMDSVKLRLERDQELSFIEFNYMVLQAYDFTVLARDYKCNLQMGASDQWGNIVTGIDLGRRLGTHQLYALTTPLLTTSSGAKMGKSVAGAVWLNEDMLSPYDFWQYWRNTEDADVPRFLKLFTTLPMGEIAKLAALRGAEINDAKKVLATEATALLHGREKAEAAALTAARTFERHEAAEGLPTHYVVKARLEEGIWLPPLLVEAGLAQSNSEVRKAIANNAISVNDSKVTDEQFRLGWPQLSNGAAKISFGRKKHVLVKPKLEPAGGRFYVTSDKQHEWRWTLLGPNDVKLAKSPVGYKTKSECLESISQVRAATSVREQIDKKGLWRCSLLADGRKIAISTRGYENKVDCIDAIRSVARASDQILERT